MTRRCAILHEGKAGKKSADNRLIKTLINDLGLDSDDVEFYSMGSKSEFFKTTDNIKYKELLLKINSGQITTVLFILDADSYESDARYGGYENTGSAIRTVIDDLDISRYADYYICCDPETKIGYLESLILSSISSSQKTCIEQFLECSDFDAKDNAKAVLNVIYNKAYPNAPYNFSHEHFDELKCKIRALFSES